MKKQVLAVLAISILLTGCAGQKPELGIKNGKLAPCPQTPNCVSSQAVGGKQYVQPILYPGSQKDARIGLFEALNSMKRVKIVTAKEDYIRAEFRSALFRFVDDVEFYLPEGQTGETVIHVRSASRIGHSDLGANRKRIEQIRSQFSK